jgi:methyl coenzyme M reductase gamma subunit
VLPRASRENKEGVVVFDFYLITDPLDGPVQMRTADEEGLNKGTEEARINNV